MKSEVELVVVELEVEVEGELEGHYYCTVVSSDVDIREESSDWRGHTGVERELI